ncbi:MAG: AbrB/MazE/SpoVT family DNA-binding domain-containing protein [Anaerolineae bacterium]|nr:AbrB/MazE/SpoVT family DNA-binding domain-containing protein [Anaerolineae bacterium]MCO5191615.1 AbrB/MazE/SpoVT family DNA-binding domain-containing protein [Anaerolineae bacterium]MCO5192203.1 AbrB/MazE/SpoVT family DNA-binding domain-containing protein [Anaerolineae bacterium]MCO5198363.1 AbrB/MazE/SpoVT family DNA-binding domain-containing protein [Anaerolineae bacterium]MCO5205770.1 AbrB/MazE/SpoVT family DNA-binding domain-containing protein [Anaerolineae bacterium]
MESAKIFQNGGSQAVRIPKAYRFDSDSVYIKQTPMGLLLIPKRDSFWENWLAQLREQPWDVTVEDIEALPSQERDWDDVFA